MTMAMTVWMQTRLSERTWVQVNVDGPMGVPEFRQMMRVLEAIGEMWTPDNGLCLEETTSRPQGERQGQNGAGKRR